MPLFFLPKRTLALATSAATGALYLAGFALLAMDRVAPLALGVIAPTKEDSSPPASGSKRDDQSRSGSRGGGDLTHSGPFVSDHEARLAINEWDEHWRRTRSN